MVHNPDFSLPVITIAYSRWPFDAGSRGREMKTFGISGRLMELIINNFLQLFFSRLKIKIFSLTEKINKNKKSGMHSCCFATEDFNNMSNVDWH